MKGKSLIAENLELAFQTWRASGQSVGQTIRTLKTEHDFAVSRPTLYEWIEKYHWKERAAMAEAEERQAKDANLSGEEKMLAALVTQKERYEKYFANLGYDKNGRPEIDTQATYAYNNLIASLVSIRQRTGEYKAELFLDFMKDLIGYLNKNDPDAVPAIERNFDEFITYAKEKYRS